MSIQDREDNTLPKPSTDVIINHSTKASTDQPADISIVAENTADDEPNHQSQYILQIKSYEKAKDADLKRAEVLMAGVDAIVVRQDKKKWLCVSSYLNAHDSKKRSLCHQCTPA